MTVPQYNYAMQCPVRCFHEVEVAKATHAERISVAQELRYYIDLDTILIHPEARAIIPTLVMRL